MAILPPDVTVYRRSAGGRQEPAKEVSDIGRANFAKAIAQQASATGIVVVGQPGRSLTATAEEELQDIRPLFAEVVATVMAHACGRRCQDEDATWETKDEHFEYSLGPLPALAEATGADTVLLMYVRTHVPSTGEVVAKSALAVLSIAAVTAGGVPSPVPHAGLGPVPAFVPPSGVLIQALVDTGTGDILWADVVVPRFIFPDLRDPAVVESLVADAFEHVTAARPSRRPKRE